MEPFADLSEAELAFRRELQAYYGAREWERPRTKFARWCAVARNNWTGNPARAKTETGAGQSPKGKAGQRR